jgi:outer membrane protein assembly factor BamB
MAATDAALSTGRSGGSGSGAERAGLMGRFGHAFGSLAQHRQSPLKVRSQELLSPAARRRGWRVMRSVMSATAGIALFLTGGCTRTRNEDRSYATSPEDGGNIEASQALDDGHTAKEAAVGPEMRRPGLGNQLPSALDSSCSWRVASSTQVTGQLWPIGEAAWDLDHERIFYAVLSRGDAGLEEVVLVAVDTTRGHELWAVRLPTGLWPRQLVRAPAGPVVLYHPGSMAIAFDAKTGVELWRKETREPNWDPEGSASRWGAGVLTLTSEGVLMLCPRQLALMNACNWSPSWSVPLDANGWLLGYAPPVVAGGKVFFIVDGQEGRRRRLAAVSCREARLLWEADLGPVLHFGEPPTVPIQLGSCSVGPAGVVCLQHRLDVVYRLDEPSGPTPEPLLVCFDSGTGKRRWERALAEWPSYGLSGFASPVVCGGLVLIAVPDNRWLVYDSADGRPVREIPKVLTEPVVIDGAVICKDDDARLTMLTPPSFQVASRIALPPSLEYWHGDVRASGGEVVLVASQPPPVEGVHEITVVVAERDR